MTLLMRHKIISPRASTSDAWHYWQRVCEDGVVRERSMKRAARKRPDYLASVMAGYSYASAVLNGMTPKEFAALRERLGVRPEKEFAVLK